ncbi:MAG: hypothetical protein U0269_22435 [Polyangiales bacterium]
MDTRLFSIELAERERRAGERQGALDRVIVEPFESAKQLWLAIRSYLTQCSNAEVLRVSQADLWKRLRLNDAGTEIYVGSKYDAVKNFHRDRERPHIERSDGAWFDFALMLRSVDGGVEVLGYNAEIRFDDGITETQARWLRFDLNPVGHTNDDERSMRAHMHAGSDDWLMPAPAFRPFELLDLLVFGLARREDRKPRDSAGG